VTGIAEGQHARWLRCAVAGAAAAEIKHPVGVRDIEALDELLETLTDDKPRIIALQPISQKEMRRVCVLRPASPATGGCRCRRINI
jgi:16S rRNA U1498 N3-methylase RsmE